MCTKIQPTIGNEKSVLIGKVLTVYYINDVMDRGLRQIKVAGDPGPHFMAKMCLIIYELLMHNWIRIPL